MKREHEIYAELEKYHKNLDTAKNRRDTDGAATWLQGAIHALEFVLNDKR